MSTVNHPPVSNDRYLAVTVLVEALGTGKSRYVACPVTGNVVSVFYAQDIAVDANNAITASIGTTAITNAGTTLTTAQAAGSVVVVNPTGGSSTPPDNFIQRGQVLKVTAAGAGTVGQTRVTFLIEQS